MAKIYLFISCLIFSTRVFSQWISNQGPQTPNTNLLFCNQNVFLFGHPYGKGFSSFDNMSTTKQLAFAEKFTGFAGSGNNVYASCEKGLFVSSSSNENWLLLDTLKGTIRNDEEQHLFYITDSLIKFSDHDNATWTTLYKLRKTEYIFDILKNDSGFCIASNLGLFIKHESDTSFIKTDVRLFQKLIFSGEHFLGLSHSGKLMEVDFHSDQSYALPTPETYITWLCSDDTSYYISGPEGIFYSHKNDLQWIKLNLDLKPEKFTLYKNNFLALTGFGLYYSNDNFHSAHLTVVPDPNSSPSSLTHNDHAIYCLWNWQLFKRGKEITSWTKSGNIPNEIVYFKAFSDTLVAISRWGLFYISYDEGESWRVESNNLPPISTAQCKDFNVIMRCGYYFLKYGGNLFRSPVTLISWEKLNCPSYYQAIDSDGSRLIITAMSKYLISDDIGQTWTELKSPGYNNYYSNGKFISMKDDTLFLAGADLNFRKLGKMPFYFITPANYFKGHIYVGGNVYYYGPAYKGIFRIDTLGNVESFMQGLNADTTDLLNTAHVSEFYNVGDALFACIDDRGVWQFGNDNMTDAIVIQPGSHSILKCFPNPFEKSFYLALPADNYSGLVDITIRDICGKITQSIKVIAGKEVLVNTDDFLPGTYLVSLRDGKGNVFTSRLVKQ